MHAKTTRGLFARFTLALTAAAAVVTFAAACSDSTGPIPFRKAAYIRSEAGGAPWSQTTNEDAMDQAFGVGEWDDLRYETVNLDSLFSVYTFIFFEGGDDDADDMEAFITANHTRMESFVSGGRRVLINAAPNEGDGMSFGFGVTLNYDGGPSATDSVEAVASTHPIFAAADTTIFTGDSFGHATVTGTGLTAIIQEKGNPAKVVLATKTFGQGRALFGGMTTDNFHAPQPDAHELRINILRYAAGKPLP